MSFIEGTRIPKTIYICFKHKRLPPKVIKNWETLNPDYNPDYGVDNGMPKYPGVIGQGNDWETLGNNASGSCVGLLFINNDHNIDRKTSCIVEYNAHNVTSATLSDTAGHDNKGFMIGDYKVSKNDYGAEVKRDGEPTISEIKTSDLAF